MLNARATVRACSWSKPAILSANCCSASREPPPRRSRASRRISSTSSSAAGPANCEMIAPSMSASIRTSRRSKSLLIRSPNPRPRSNWPLGRMDAADPRGSGRSKTRPIDQMPCQLKSKTRSRGRNFCRPNGYRSTNPASERQGAHDRFGSSSKCRPGEQPLLKLFSGRNGRATSKRRRAGPPDVC